MNAVYECMRRNKRGAIDFSPVGSTSLGFWLTQAVCLLWGWWLLPNWLALILPSLINIRFCFPITAHPWDFSSLKHKSFGISDSLLCFTVPTLTLLLCFLVWFIYMSISALDHWGFLQSRAEHFHLCPLQKPSSINESRDKLAPMENVITWRRVFCVCQVLLRHSNKKRSMKWC